MEALTMEGNADIAALEEITLLGVILAHYGIKLLGTQNVFVFSWLFTSAFT